MPCAFSWHAARTKLQCGGVIPLHLYLQEERIGKEDRTKSERASERERERDRARARARARARQRERERERERGGEREEKETENEKEKERERGSGPSQTIGVISIRMTPTPLPSATKGVGRFGAGPDRWTLTRSKQGSKREWIERGSGHVRPKAAQTGREEVSRGKGYFQEDREEQSKWVCRPRR